MKTILPVLSVFLMLILGTALVTAQQPATTLLGNITGAFNTTGTVVDVFLGSNSSPTKSFTLGYRTNPYDPVSTATTYAVTVQCNNDSTIFIKLWGVNASAAGCKYGDDTVANASAAAVANSASCSYANACSSGFCCSGSSAVNSSTGSGTCQSTACSGSSSSTSSGGGGSGSGSSGGGSGGGGGATAPAAPSQDTVDTVKTSLPASFSAPNAKVEFKTISAPEVKKVEVAPEAVATTLAQIETIVKTEEAKQALAAIQQEVASGGSSPVSVTKTIEVVQATNTATGEKVTVSVVKLSVKAPTDKGLKDVEVVEVIPKAAANNINLVTFKGEKPTVLEADPVVKWTFAEVPKGQSKDLSYTINKDISNIGTSTVAVSKPVAAAPAVPPGPAAPTPEKKKEEVAPAPPAKKPTPLSSLALVVIVAVVVIGGWLFLKGRKKVMK